MFASEALTEQLTSARPFFGAAEEVYMYSKGHDKTVQLTAKLSFI